MKNWQQKKTLLDSINTQLTQLRSQYSTANATQKTQLGQQIIDMENQIELLYEETKSIEKQIRQFELN